MLNRKGEAARILRLMHAADFLGRYLPEFGHLTCLVQHEYFHRYTADEHTLVCLEKLDALRQTEDPKLQPYRDLFEKIADPYVLYLALLLHDTGKGVGARPHSEASALFAQGVAVRLQLSSEQRRSLVLLVDHHVTLSSMAQQRNVDDPATVIELANIVKSPSNLDLLMLLTLADGQGTSDLWSDWKESLVWSLYHATARYLRDQEGFIAQTKIERDKLRQTVDRKARSRVSPTKSKRTSITCRTTTFAPSTSKTSLRISTSFKRSGAIFICATIRPPTPALLWEALPQEGHSVVSICTWERQHLLASIAGAFAVASVNILSADIFIRDDNLVLDVFRVCNQKLQAVTDPAEIAGVESILRIALQEERFNFDPLLASVRRKTKTRSSEIDFPTRITIENKSHPTCTLIEVETSDRLGSALRSRLLPRTEQRLHHALAH